MPHTCMERATLHEVEILLVLSYRYIIAKKGEKKKDKKKRAIIFTWIHLLV